MFSLVLAAVQNVGLHQRLKCETDGLCLLQEGLRRYPAGGVAPFRAVAAGHGDVSLDEGRLIIPEGAILHMPIIAVHMLPSIWEDPDKFDPERWLKVLCFQRYTLQELSAVMTYSTALIGHEALKAVEKKYQLGFAAGRCGSGGPPRVLPAQGYSRCAAVHPLWRGAAQLCRPETGHA